MYNRRFIYKKKENGTEGQIKPKYINKKITTDEGTFDSKLEYDCYLMLKELERLRSILRGQPISTTDAATGVRPS